MTATAERTTPRASRLAGYLFALAAGAIWGTTGPLSTALYRAGEAITGIGFWRLVIGLLGFVVYGLFRPQLFRIGRKAWLLVGLGGGALVALFEVAYQFGIAGTGVAGAAALLYIAPVLVAILAKNPQWEHPCFDQNHRAEQAGDPTVSVLKRMNLRKPMMQPSSDY